MLSSAVFGLIGAATGAWVVSYVLDLFGLVPNEDGDILREAMSKANRKKRPWQ
jgi:hypothetical protein